jgi:hypothetical protein
MRKRCWLSRRHVGHFTFTQYRVGPLTLGLLRKQQAILEREIAELE